MKARKTGKKRPSRIQVSWTLVKEEPRVAILFWFFIVVAIANLVFGFLTLFEIVSQGFWPWAGRVLGLLLFAVLADALVLAGTFWGVRHFSIFSRLDRMFTHLPVAALGLALMVLASYNAFTKPYHPHRPLDPPYALAMLCGSLLFFWVFLFYGRKRPVA